MSEPIQREYSDAELLEFPLSYYGTFATNNREDKPMYAICRGHIQVTRWHATKTQALIEAKRLDQEAAEKEKK